MEACPLELRPYLQALEDSRDMVMGPITHKNRLNLKLQQLTKALEVAETLDQRSTLETQLESLRKEAEEAQRAFDEVKAVNLRAEQDLYDRRIEYRVNQFPAPRQEEARALILEEQAALRSTTFQSMNGRTYGEIAGLFFGLDLRLKQAQQTQNQQEIARLTPLHEKAEADFKAALEKIETTKSQAAEIQKTYAQKLNALTHP